MTTLDAVQALRRAAESTTGQVVAGEDVLPATVLMLGDLGFVRVHARPYQCSPYAGSITDEGRAYLDGLARP